MMPKGERHPQIRGAAGRATLVLAAAAALGCSALSALVDTEPPDSPPLADCTLTVAGDGNLRVLALGYRVQSANLETFPAYRASLERPVSDTVADCLPPHGRSILLYPAGFERVAALLGARAAAARDAGTWSAARDELRLAYADEINAYRQRFPAAGTEDLLDLALVNPVWQSTVNTFGAIARRHGVPVVVAAETAAAAAPSTAPGDRDAFGDPALFAVTTYVAETADIRQLAFVFDPTGALTATVRLPYGSRAGRHDAVALAALAPVTMQVGVTVPSDLVPNPAPVELRLAILPGANAFAPQVRTRLADLDANLALFPAAISGGWTTPEPDRPWPPDAWLDAAWGTTQRHPTVVAGALAALSGNLGDVVYDGQSHVAVDATPSAPAQRLVGGDQLPGLAATGAWAITDPIVDDPTQDQATRRATLTDAGNDRAPDGPLAGDYVTSVAAADVSLPAAGALPFGTGVSAPHQWNPHVVQLTNGTLLAVWTERDRGDADIAWGIVGEAGLERRGTVAAAAQPAADIRVAAQTTGAVAVWSQGVPGNERIRAARFDGDEWATPVVLDSSGGPQWWPDVDGEGSRYTVVWTDLRGGWGQVRYVVAADDTIGTAKRIDGNVADAATTAVYRARVALAGERVVVGFSAADPGGWAAYARRSTDAGGSFNDRRRVDAGGDRVRAVVDDVRIDTAATNWVAYTNTRDTRALPGVYAAFASDDTGWFERRLSASGARFDHGASIANVGDELWAAWHAFDDAGMRLRTTHGATGIGFLTPIRVLPDAAAGQHAWMPSLIPADPTPGAIYSTAPSGFGRATFLPALPRE